jgi:exodeoxyribonuclease III
MRIEESFYIEKMIKIISWNVNGLRAVYGKGAFQIFLNAVQDADIICLQETKASIEQLPEEVVYVPGYKSYFASGEKKGYSGVAIYTKQQPQSVQKGFGIPEFDNEGRILVADYGEFVLFNIYYPNGKMSPIRLDYKMRFYEAFLETVDQLKADGRNVVVCGDVNTAHKEIDLDNPKANEKTSGFLPQERDWIDKFLSHGYADTFRMFNQSPKQYTWWDMRSFSRSKNVGWRLDYFYVNNEFKSRIRSAFILPDVLGSDHCPVGIEII